MVDAVKQLSRDAKTEHGQTDQERFDDRGLCAFRKRYPPMKIEPLDSEEYRRAIEGIIALAGTEPDLVAPPRRRFD